MDKAVHVGDYVYLPKEKRPYKVMARNERYIICTKNCFGKPLYFIVDLVNKWRAPDNMVFCFGYENKEQCEERLKELVSGEIELSTRRGVPLDIDIL